MKQMKGIAAQSSVWWKVCQFVMLTVVCTLLALGVWAAVWHGSQSVFSLKMMQMLQTTGTFMLPCFAGAYLWSEKPMEWLHIDRGTDWRAVGVVVVLMLCAVPGVNLLAWLNGKMELPAFLSGLEELMKAQEEAAGELTERFIRADSIGELLLNVCLMALLPAFSEELCFRGTLFTLFSGKGNRHVALWAVAILFSAIHFQFYGFVPRMLLGALFGYMLLWSGSLWLPVLAHFVNNCTAVVLYNLYYMRGRNTDEIDMFGTEDTWWAGILSLLLTAVLIAVLHRVLHSSRRA
ncbi:MAG: CPBP family intramembrane metalloprotease [Paludibacteraceae bacterium]|nr:CPBP family intramembrane metalloprotease [Paludibacteraceae bacterium]